MWDIKLKIEGNMKFEDKTEISYFLLNSISTYQKTKNNK